MQKHFIFLAYASLFSLGILDNSRGPIFPLLLSDFGVASNVGSFFFFFSSMAELLINLVGRFWTPFFSSLQILRGSLVFMIVGSWGIALAQFQQLNFYWVLLFSFLLGLGFSGASIAQNMLCAEGSTSRLRRKVLNGLHANYGLASLLAPLILNVFFFYGLSYSWHFIFITLFPLITLISSFSAQELVRPVNEIKVDKIPCPLFERFFWGLPLALYVAAEILLSTRVVSFLLAEGMSLSHANIYLSLFFVALLFGRLFFALVHPPLSNWNMLFLSLFSTLACFALGLLFHPVGLILCGLTMSFYFPYAMDTMLEAFPRHIDFMTASVMSMVGLVLMVMHALVGQLTTWYGIKWAFLAAPFFTLLALLTLAIHRFFLYKKV